VRFPIVAFYKNIVFTVQGRTYAFYRLPSVPYRFFPLERKEMCVGTFEEMLLGFSGRGQVLLLWEEMGIDEGGYARLCLQGRRAGFTDEFLRHVRAARASLFRGARRLRRFVLFELTTSRSVSDFREFLHYLRDAALKAVLAVRPMEPPPQLRAAAVSAERDLFSRLRRFGIERADFADLDFAVRKCAGRVGVLPPPLPEREGGVFTPAAVAAFTDGGVLEEHLNYVAVSDGSGKKHYQAFVFFVDFPKRMPEWGTDVFNPDPLGFPFDVVIHFTILPPHVAAKRVDLKQRLLQAQVDEAYKAGEGVGVYEELGLRDGRSLQAKIEAGKPLASASVCLAVSSFDLGEASSRASQLCEHFLQMNFRAVRPSAKQLDALFSFLPGAPPAAPAVECDPGYIASLGPHFAFELGDARGFFLGWSGQSPVFWFPGRPAEELNKTNAVLISGSLGGGKSYLSKLLAYFTLLSGGYVLAVDPKDEYGSFGKLFGSGVRTVDLSPRGGVALNPFTLSQDEARAKGIAMDYLTLALNAAGNEPRRLALAQALERLFNLFPVAERHLENFGKMLVVVAKESPHSAVREEAGQSVFILRSLRESDIGRMVFGRSQGRIFGEETRMVVLNIKEIPRPRPGVPPERFTESERQGLAVIYLIAAVAREAAFGLPRSVLKMLVFDEAWVLASVSEGERLLDEVIRIGRTFNLIPVLITQNITDLDIPTVVNNVSQVFCFRALSSAEAEANLRILGADSEAVKPETFAGLRPGQCLFRDAEGRIGWLQVEVQPPYLGELFDTRPSKTGTEGEKDKCYTQS